MALPVLTRDEFERRRRPRDLVLWVEKIHQSFGETREGRDAMRLHELPLLKEFTDEIWPLATYAKLFHAEAVDLWLQPVLGDQTYDALVLDNSGRQIGRLELTLALYGSAGYQDRLRRERMVKYGHAPETGPSLTREKATKELSEAWGECEEHEGRVLTRLQDLENAVRAKAAKPYASDVGLIVEIQGDVFRKEDQEYVRVDDFARSTLLQICSRFRELAIVDDAAQFGFRYDLRASPSA